MAKKGRMVYRRRCERDADTDREKNTLNLNKEQVRETRRLTHMAQRHRATRESFARNERRRLEKRRREKGE